MEPEKPSQAFKTLLILKSLGSSCHLQSQNLIQLLIALATSLSILFKDGMNTFILRSAFNKSNAKQPGLKSYKLKS